VYQGAGGLKTDYREFASSQSARYYETEGEGILSEEDLRVVNRSPESSDEAVTRMKEYLRTHKDVEIVLLTSPTDVVQVLEEEPELKRNIKHIYVFGGWAENGEGGKKES
jgi:inosine-uridine nucleoside N-ribohydrolase